MVTKNWYTALKSNMLRKIIPNGLTNWDGAHVASGFHTSSTNVLESLCFYMFKAVFVTGSEGIVLGSGTTPATINDYKLDSMITAGLTVSVVRSVSEEDDLVYTLTITNDSTDNITIGEIGIVDLAYTGESAGYKQVLMERTVLDYPITIPPEEVGVIDYTIHMAIPQA